MRTPTKFVGLHAHSVVGSVGDAIGLPQDHIEFALSNGADALALTDHGNMNGISHQQSKLADLKKSGRLFKGLIGIEAYFIDDLEDHMKLRVAHNEEEAAKKRIVLAAKAAKSKKTVEELALEELEETVGNESKADEDEATGTVIENEAESKNLKYLDPLKQRNHLVLLAKNNAGVKSLFSLTSEASKSGFYRFPRMDFNMLRGHANGNIIATSACVSGEAVLYTNYGILSLKTVVELVKTKTVYVLGFSTVEKRFKFERVVAGQLTKKKASVVRVTLLDGKKITCTPDHKVLTNYGWVRADELATKADLLVYTFNKDA